MITHKSNDGTRAWTIFGIVAVCLFLGAVALCGIGCSAEQQQNAAEVRQQAEAVRLATTQAVTDLEVEIATLPPNDPVRKAAESKLKVAREKLAQLNRYIPAVDAAINAANNGDLTGLRDATRDIPYAPLVITAGSILFAAYQKIQKARATTALSQVVKGVEQVLPQKTEQQKLVLEAAQDESTKALVAQVKG